ncbi:MAG: methionine--tRNA ligase subunit beta [Planctomycetes bacterium]|nr:methionine--tRNA ligase subunit beta [Planctomycetota bacterium]
MQSNWLCVKDDGEGMTEPVAAGEIEIGDFAKVELRTARVLAAEPHPDADKLLVLTLQAGTEQRTICAGIRPWWTPEALVGKDVVIVANLKPRKLRGVMSQGMLLAVQDGDDVVPLTGMKPVASGLRVS